MDTESITPFYVTLLSFCRSILAFIMIPLMQQQLDESLKQYGTIEYQYRIRVHKHTLMADGIPYHIFAFPDRYNMKI